MSSCRLLRFRCLVRPGGRLVIAGAGLEAAVLDADEAVGELAQGRPPGFAPDAPPARLAACHFYAG